ncbi:MAG: cell wall hydrolase/autolysin [Firmicutes bacterium]|nr:cell wall hydrolase/autolysin [Bacillota bacterium]
MYKQKLLLYLLLIVMVSGIIAPIQVSHAASVGSVLSALTAPTATHQEGGGIFNALFDLVFKKILGPILNIFDGKSTPSSGSSQPNPVKKGSLIGKVVVVDPGHGGSNPGAIANNNREADNNLAVGLKLRDKLLQAGAKVIMTRDSDRTVAPEGSSLTEELKARVNIAEANNADIFVSVHSNSNPNTAVAGAMTFYAQSAAPQLAEKVQSSLINETQAVNKGISTANFYVLRNSQMPSILVEMGFVSNADEATRLGSDVYRDKIAQGIFNGISSYFQNK